MSEIHSLFALTLRQGEFVEAVFSNVRKKSLATYKKLLVRPVDIKGNYLIQLEYHYDKKVMHENLEPGEAARVLEGLMEGYFKQAMVHTVNADFHMLSNKKAVVKILEKKPTKSLVSYAHNQKKQYVLEEDVAHDFLVELGIMSEEGQVFKKKYNKFKQINRYLEILEDAIKSVKFDEVVRVVDFGCGKAYLTFAMYYYFVVLKNQPVEIIGLDLKADVIAHLTEIKERLGYDSLIFKQGDIKNFNWDKQPDIVVSLHACDTATDEAIGKAIEWDTKVIMAVPCCQHEAYTQIAQPEQQLLLKHGILKERFAAMTTDALRANLMEIMGYQTVVMEFIDMEHTPKNLMIRGINSGVKKPEMLDEFKKFTGYWSLRPHLERLLSKQLKEMLMDKE